jgi:predicted glutamine amidotransferase
VCRWLAYSGPPILLEELLYTPAHSLIDHSLRSRLGAETTNGDGFGVGWYGTAETPALFHSVEPAWNDSNLRDLATHISSPLVFAHVRASSGSAIQQTNCHPFRHDRWLWMHNGLIRNFDVVKRDLALAVDPSLYSKIGGSTDSELLFFLALTYGLEEDAVAGVERAVGFVEATGRAHGVEHPIHMTIATTNGRQMWVFRYSSERKSRSLYFSTSLHALRALYPDNPMFENFSETTRIVVSEPLGDLPGAWNEMPEGSVGILDDMQDMLVPFAPVPEAISVSQR